MDVSGKNPQPKRAVYDPAAPEPESGCMKAVLECIGQGTFAVATLFGTVVKGPLGWLLAALVLAAGLLCAVSSTGFGTRPTGSYGAAVTLQVSPAPSFLS